MIQYNVIRLKMKKEKNFEEEIPIKGNKDFRIQIIRNRCTADKFEDE